VSTERFEYKYPLSSPVYRRLTAALRPYARHDEYSRRNADHRYYVRSLYFDTSDYRAYAEKVTGESNRIKLRIRTYARKAVEAEFVSVELKTREGALVRKFSTHVSLDEYLHFEEHRSWTRSDPVLIEFERLVRLGDLRPVLLVDYWREAFVARDRADVRVTIDHGVVAAQSAELFPERALFRSSDPLIAVLEIKVADARPDWLEGLVRGFDLQSVPNSKYARGIEQTQNRILVRR
jgi:SPX domain protein involved in polyphosphate accumulation